MADMKQINSFAVKWINKFKDKNISYIELVDHYMADDCDALGFNMDCGEGFEKIYGNAVCDYRQLKKKIDSITDIMLLGSAVYSRWRYFNHWAYDGKEITEPENRLWFILALERMAELTEIENDTERAVIIFPEVAKMKKEIEKLHIELSMLLLERDELKYVECKNIEMKYMLVLGALEHKAFKLNCQMLRLKRKIELIQAKKNRQENVSISDIDKILDNEFAQYQEELNKQIDKMNSALERSKGEALSEEETKELKSLYRTIVKTLHPDIHPDVTKAQLNLFQNAVEAYENADINALRIIKEMVDVPELQKSDEKGPDALIKEKERLLNMIEQIRKQISEIKESYPYNLKSIVQSEQLTAEKKADLEDTVSRLQEMIEMYKRRIEEMLR